MDAARVFIDWGNGKENWEKETTRFCRQMVSAPMKHMNPYEYRIYWPLTRPCQDDTPMAQIKTQQLALLISWTQTTTFYQTAAAEST